MHACMPWLRAIGSSWRIRAMLEKGRFLRLIRGMLPDRKHSPLGQPASTIIPSCIYYTAPLTFPTSSVVRLQFSFLEAVGPETCSILRSQVIEMILATE